MGNFESRYVAGRGSAGPSSESPDRGHPTSGTDRDMGHSSATLKFVSGHGLSRAAESQGLIRALAPARLLLCQIAVAIGILLRRIGQPCFHRVLSNVLPIFQEAFLLVGARLGKPA